jgi:HSP20 family protein
MQTLMPTTGLTSLRKEMDRLFDRFWEDGPDLLPTGEWAPSLDLSETKDALVARVEVPGMEPKDIQLTIRDNVLTVRGEKKREAEHKDERFFRSERSYGTFLRAMRLPLTVDEAKVNARFKDGVLTVTMPKGAGARGITIPVTPN